MSDVIRMLPSIPGLLGDEVRRAEYVLKVAWLLGDPDVSVELVLSPAAMTLLRRNVMDNFRDRHVRLGGIVCREGDGPGLIVGDWL